MTHDHCLGGMGFPRPGELWSLWDMLERYAVVFHSLSGVLVALELKLIELVRERIKDGTIETAKFDLDMDFWKDLQKSMRAFDALPIGGARKRLARIIKMFEPSGTADLKQVERAWAEFNQTLRDELDDVILLALASEEDRGLYRPKQPLFGDDVFDRFPVAIDDIAEAGKCLALERGTAAVFHLMRVMEAGLKALGAELGIVYAPSWESYIRQLNSLLDSSNYDKLTPEQKSKRPFYQDVLGDLTSIKGAWRNPTMHIVRSYDAKQARTVFEAVKALMQHLAKELSADPAMQISTGQSS